LAMAREDYAATHARLSVAEDRPLPRSEEHVTAAYQLSELERHIARLVQRLQLAGAELDTVELHAAVPTTTRPTLTPGTLLIEFFPCGDDLLRFQGASSGMTSDILEHVVPETHRLPLPLRLPLDSVERTESQFRHRHSAQARQILGRLYT